MIAGIVFNCLPFFRAKGNAEQLRRISEVLGTEGLFQYIEKYNLHVDPEVMSQVSASRKKDWTEFASDGNPTFLCTELYDLLDNLLIYDHHVVGSGDDSNSGAIHCEGVHAAPLF